MAASSSFAVAAFLVLCTAVCFTSAGVTLTSIAQPIPAAGGVAHVTGSGLSSIVHFVQVSISGVACTNPVVSSDTSFTCSAGAGVGKGKTISITYNDSHDNVTASIVDFMAPQVTGAKVDLTNTHKRASAVRVVITGENFGVPAPAVHITVKIGGFHCVNLHHVSDNEIRCSVDGVGANAGIEVIVNGQSSAPTATILGGASVRFDFPNVATPGLDCVPPFGAVDFFNPERCNCWSGSAPADNLAGTECSLKAVCPGRVSTLGVIGQNSPARPVTEFKNDNLHIKQTMPIVNNRRDTIIQFVVPNLLSTASAAAAGTVGSSSCFYPGNIWAKKVNTLDCFDEFYGVLPWSQNELCGFVEDTDNTILASPQRVYRTSLVTSYTETFKKSDGSILFRKVSNSFLVTVSFTRRIIAISKAVSAVIADEKDPNSLEITVNGDALYDVASKNTIVTFTTTIAWPYKIDSITLPGTWKKALGNGETGAVHASAELASAQGSDFVCGQTQDTECEQSWILTIETLVDVGPQVCNLQGLFEFSTSDLLCRDYDSVGACAGTPAPSTNFTILMGKTDLCDTAADIDATAGLAISLETFYDSEHTVPQNSFQTGDVVFFKLDVIDPTSTIDQITFREINVRSSGNNVIPDMVRGTGNNAIVDYLYRVDNTGDLPTDAVVYHTGSQFNITQELRQPFLAPGDSTSLGFKFRLTRSSLNVVSTLGATANDNLKEITIEATIDLLYHGNQKRTLSLSSGNALPALARTQISFFDMEDVEQEEMIPHANDANTEADLELSLFASPSSQIVASVAAVVAGAALILA